MFTFGVNWKVISLIGIKARSTFLDQILIKVGSLMLQNARKIKMATIFFTCYGYVCCKSLFQGYLGNMVYLPQNVGK